MNYISVIGRLIITIIINNVRYDELEQQAMEQYRTSEESLALKYQVRYCIAYLTFPSFHGVCIWSDAHEAHTNTKIHIVTSHTRRSRRAKNRDRGRGPSTATRPSRLNMTFKSVLTRIELLTKMGDDFLGTRAAGNGTIQMWKRTGERVDFARDPG